MRRLSKYKLRRIVEEVLNEQPGLGNYIDVLGAGSGFYDPINGNSYEGCLEYNSGKNKMSQLLTYVSKLPTGQITPQVQKWNDRLYKAMKGLGTGQDYINVLKELKTPTDLAMIYKTFKYEGENLWEWMSGESKYSWDDTWNAIPQSVTQPAKIKTCLKYNTSYGGMSEQYFNNIGKKAPLPKKAKKELTKIASVDEVSQKDFDEEGEPSAEMIRISFPVGGCDVHMVGFMKPKKVGDYNEQIYTFIPMEGGFSYDDCDESNTGRFKMMNMIERDFKKLVNKELTIDSDLGPIRFGKKNYGVKIWPLLLGDDSVLFEKI